MRGNPTIVSAIILEQAILDVYKAALLEEFKGRRRADFMTELRHQIRSQAFRIAALERMNR